MNINICKTYIEDSNNKIDLRSRLHPKKKYMDTLNYPKYTQTFGHIHGYIPNLSILDLLFNEGPESMTYIKSIVNVDISS